jgi:hypothetical protein
VPHAALAADREEERAAGGFRYEIPLRKPEKRPSGDLSVAGQGPTALEVVWLAPSP